MLCECGCGNPAPISKVSCKHNKWIKGAPKRFIQYHHLKGKTNPRYKGGLYFSSDKNRWVIICRDGSREYYARAVMESIIKRQLAKDEIVHHVDGDSANDSPGNLQLMNVLDHNLLSSTKYTKEQLLDYLNLFHKKNGRTPTGKDFLSSPNYPHRSSYERIFGGWNNALRLAGLPTQKGGDPKCLKR